ncbi:MAG TPA: hypothetical protein DDW52_12080, partial [Planctomycetaceae bacterium]|nr:hypothetical protein [Planctomycetaceae bacterium]
RTPGETTKVDRAIARQVAPAVQLAGCDRAGQGIWACEPEKLVINSVIQLRLSSASPATISGLRFRRDNP